MWLCQLACQLPASLHLIFCTHSTRAVCLICWRICALYLFNCMTGNRVFCVSPCVCHEESNGDARQFQCTSTHTHTVQVRVTNECARTIDGRRRPMYECFCCVSSRVYVRSEKGPIVGLCSHSIDRMMHVNPFDTVSLCCNLWVIKAWVLSNLLLSHCINFEHGWRRICW